MSGFELLEKVNLSLHCNYKTGGLAKYFVAPKNNQELGSAIFWAEQHGVPREIIGGGSNLLISDEGYDGIIISTDLLNRFICKRGQTVSCGAGIKLVDLVCYCINAGVSGLENLSGIPGCLGGALRMNAGAFGTEIKDVVSNISYLSEKGIEEIIPVEKACYGYRASPGLDGVIITGCEFTLKKGNASELEKIKNNILARRKEKQPLDKPSCGSVFKRPLGGFAGAFIEECGLKGLKHGDAAISDKHANFILNLGKAKSSDIKWLIDKVIETIFKEKGVRLEPEVKLIGF